MTGPKKVKLGSIAEIISGIDLRQSEKDLTESAGLRYYNVIQPNHLGGFNDILPTENIRKEPVDSSFLIKKNDILLKRLNADNPTLILEEMPDTIFSNNLFVIRVSIEYSPAYIACFLENRGLAMLSVNLVGSVAAIRSLSAKALALLEIPAIEYEKQEIIGNLWLLHKKRKQLLKDLILEDQRFIAAVVNRIVS